MKKPLVDNRPKNLNLLTIRLPINAVVSIMHRAAGIVLFLLLPIMIYVFQQSVSSQADFIAVHTLLSHWFVKLCLVGISWAFFHHFFAGIRHLLQDMHWFTSLPTARFSSRIVLWMDVVSVLLFAWWIWS